MLLYSAGKESACNARDPSLIPGWRRSPGEGIGCTLQYSWASLAAQWVQNPPTMWEILQFGRSGFDSWVRKIPRRRAWQPTPVFLPGEPSWTEKPGGLQSMGVTKSQTQLSIEAQCMLLFTAQLPALQRRAYSLSMHSVYSWLLHEKSAVKCIECLLIYILFPHEPSLHPLSRRCG